MSHSCVCTECGCGVPFLRPFMDRIRISSKAHEYITRWLCEECHENYSLQAQLEHWDAQETETEPTGLNKLFPPDQDLGPISQETKGDTPPPPSEPLPDIGESPETTIMSGLRRRGTP